MKSIKSALIVACSGLFFLIFLLTSAFDFALTFSGSIWLLFFSKNYIPVFSISAILFFLNFVFDYFDINFRYISDLSVDAYMLLVLGVLIYLRLKNKTLDNYLYLINNDIKTFDKDIIPKIIASIILTILLFPILGGPIAAIVSYIFFSVFTNKNNGKIAVFIAILILSLISVVLLFKNKIIAESLGIYAYSFLLVGILQEVINYLRGIKG